MPKPGGGVGTWAKPRGGGGGGSGGCDTSKHDDEHEEPSPLFDCSLVGSPALMPGGPGVGHIHQCRLASAANALPPPSLGKGV